MKRRKQRQDQPLQREQAVALRYDEDRDETPVVVAKGKGIVAKKIIEEAKRHDVPVQQDASLVEVLSKLELNQQIPPELYQLVAEVLSFVYRSDQRAREWGTGDGKG
jgi:flagellar biosynthesis protein